MIFFSIIINFMFLFRKSINKTNLQFTRKMSKFKIALCQTEAGEDKLTNLNNAKRALEIAEDLGAKLAILPECFNSPYSTAEFPRHAEIIPETENLICSKDHPSTAMLVDSAVKTGMYVIGGSIPERHEEKVYNTCIIISPEGKIIAKHRKVHLFDIDVPGKITFRESDTLTAGDSVTVFDTPFCKIGVGICYDIRFPEYAELMRLKGAQMFVYPGAFNMTTGPAHWELLQRARAVDNQVYVAAVSPARNSNTNSYQAWGHSSLFTPWGSIAATTNHEPDVVCAEVDMNEVTQMRKNIPTSSQKRNDIYRLVETNNNK